jgi:hypothetical protein
LKIFFSNNYKFHSLLCYLPTITPYHNPSRIGIESRRAMVSRQFPHVEKSAGHRDGDLQVKHKQRHVLFNIKLVQNLSPERRNFLEIGYKMHHIWHALTWHSLHGESCSKRVKLQIHGCEKVA